MNDSFLILTVMKRWIRSVLRIFLNYTKYYISLILFINLQAAGIQECVKNDTLGIISL